MSKPTDEQIKVWDALIEEWQTDWGPCLDYLIASTDLEDRDQAMRFLTMKYTNAKAASGYKQAEYTGKILESGFLEKAKELIEQELGQDEDWRG